MNEILVQPTDQISNLGLVTEFHCEGSTGCTYQWQIRPHNGTFSDITEPEYTPTTDTLHYVPDSYERYYRCKLTFPGEILYTNEVEIIVGQPANTGMYNGWWYCERYEGLTMEQKWHNLERLMRILISWGWTKECAAAVAGNVWAESNASPGTWEDWPRGGEERTGRGYGFVQWTAASSTIIPYCMSTFPGQQWRNNGDFQVERLKYEWNHGIEWVRYGGWNNVHSTDAPADICERFIRGYLRPTEAEIEATLGTRMRYSLYCFEHYSGFLLIPILKKMTREGRKNR